MMKQLLMFGLILTSATAFAKPKCLDDLCVGQRVYAILPVYSEYDYQKLEAAEAKIVDINESGRYVLKYLFGPKPENIGHTDDWERRELVKIGACAKPSGVCVGTKTYIAGREGQALPATIVAIEDNGHYILKYKDESGAMKAAAEFSDEDLARTSGCTKDLCVGKIVYVGMRSNAKAKVVGIDVKSQYIVQFLNGPLAKKTEGPWDCKFLSADPNGQSTVCAPQNCDPK